MAQGDNLAPRLTAVGRSSLALRWRAKSAGWLRASTKTPAYRAEAASRRAAAISLLQRFRLGPFAAARPSSLPFGRRRLLQLAAAAATGPLVLMLDEPSGRMQPDEVEDLEAVVAEMRDSGVGILLVAHDVRLLRRLADRLTVLSEGRVLATGPVDDVLRDEAVRRAYLGSVA